MSSTAGRRLSASVVRQAEVKRSDPTLSPSVATTTCLTVETLWLAFARAVSQEISSGGLSGSTGGSSEGLYSHGVEALTVLMKIYRAARFPAIPAGPLRLVNPASLLLWERGGVSAGWRDYPPAGSEASP